MIVQRGDVVLVHYPFATGIGGRVRPALVIRCDSNNARLANTIIAQITSRTRFARTEPTQILIEATSAAGKQAGLLVDSAISCENLYTIRHDGIARKIGEMPVSIMKAMNDCLKASLDIT